MASFTESVMWKHLVAAFGGDWIADRIESRTGNHVPDVAYTAHGHHGWIELKVLIYSKKFDQYRTRKPMPLGQARWLVERDRAAGWTYLLAASEEPQIWWLVPGTNAPLLARGPVAPGLLQQVAVGMVVGAPPGALLAHL